MADIENVNESAPAEHAVARADEAGAVMAGSNEATIDEKIAGIVAQVRQDHGGEDTPVVAAKIRERFEQAGIEVDDEKLAGLARDVAGHPSDFNS